MTNRRIFYSSIVGAVFALTPIAIERLTDTGPWAALAAALMLPGGIVALALAGGIVHWMAWQAIVVTNFLFYSALAYFALIIRVKLVNKRRHQSPEKPISAAGVDAGSRS